MSDNEKRAHDLAVAVAIDLCHYKMEAPCNDSEVHVDYFAEYMNAYNICLESFNEKFPDGK